MGTKRFKYQENKHHWHFSLSKLRKINRLYDQIDTEKLYCNHGGRGDSPQVDASPKYKKDIINS
jgi:hypothetical protein